MRTLLTLPYLNLYLHEGAAPVLELQWLSYAASADFRAAALQALHFSQHYHVKAWLGDDRLLGAVRPRDLDWAEQAILVELDKLGLERFALLDAQDTLNRRTINSMYTRVEPTLHFEIRRFDELIPARVWAGCGA